MNSTMIEIHCYNCGGFISDPSMISHRLPASIKHKAFGAVPTSALCTCTPPVVYATAAAAGHFSSPDQWRLN
jgi:hypothetical protein